MEVYRALADFEPALAERYPNVLSFHRGDRFEVFETDRSKRSHQEWWGVRRLQDDRIGYVPAKYVQYEDNWAAELPDDYEEQRQVHMRVLEDMQHQDDIMPDLYKLPPLEIQPFDEWKDHPSDDAPKPDYSDSEESDTESKENGAELVTGDSKDKRATLTQAEWEKILASADDDLGFPDPPDLDIPDPDYQEDDFQNGGFATGDSSPSLSPKHGGHHYGMVEPKKLQNPVLDSKEHQKLHRELLMNAKLGIDPLKKKSELKREFERRAEEQKKREMEEYKKNKRTPFQVKLDEQASRMKKFEYTNKGPPANEPRSVGQKPEETPEFLRVHSKIQKKPSS